MNYSWTLLVILKCTFVIQIVQCVLLDDVLSTAFCIAQCSNAHCRQACNSKNFTKIPNVVRDVSRANLQLQCKDANRFVLKHEPGVYVVEHKNKSRDEWISPVISKKVFYQSKNLEPGNEYQYRIRRVTPQGVFEPETSPWFKTNEETYVPKKVRKLFISKIEASEANKNQLQTELNIVPADDFNCLYEIVHKVEQKVYQYQLDAYHDYRLKLKHLEYGKNNTVEVTSKNKLSERHSENVALTFLSPSCLSIHHNLIKCAPPPVTGLKATFRSRENYTDVEVGWDTPKLIPSNYTVIVYPLDFENISSIVNVYGNESSAAVPNVTWSHEYEIGVYSVSDGGISLETKKFMVSDHRSVGVRPEIIVVASALITITICLSIMYAYYRYNYPRDPDCRYNFFESIHRNKNCIFEDVKNSLKSTVAYDTEYNKWNEKYEIPIDRLSIKKVLGSGISGIVKLATLQDDQKRTINVAVKMLREDASVDDVKNFHREILLMKSAGNHRNIVSLIGCCTSIENPLLIVEYCSKGDLQTYLKTIFEETMVEIFRKAELFAESSENSPFLQPRSHQFLSSINNRLYDLQNEKIFQSKLKPEDLLNFARQVATGMEFLSSNRIVHRDLAARNVLVCDDRTVKISDFGLSRDIYQENVYKKQSNEKLPLKWMAIEALTHQTYTTYSDVWSFGVLLYEIVTLGGTPYPGYQSTEILHLLKSGYRMERPQNCGYQLYEIMLSCWHDNPLSRPTFSQLKQKLDRLLNNMTRNEYLNISELLREPVRYKNLPSFEKNTPIVTHVSS